MSIEAIKYCARAVVRHLNGDTDLFKTYAREATKAYKQEQCIATLEEIIPTTTKIKLYEMVS